MPAGTNRRLVTVKFDISGSASPGTQTPLQFIDQPARRETSNLSAQALPTDYVDGFVDILAPSAANVAVAGRVATSSGQGIAGAIVILTDSAGNSKVARTNGFGYYRIEDVATGAAYVIDVRHKYYTFASRTINVDDAAEEVNFVPDN